MNSHTENVKLYLQQFRLSTMKQVLEKTIVSAERENWTYSTFLEILCEHEANQRSSKKLVNLLKNSKLPKGKTIDNLNEQYLPLSVRKLLPVLLEGEFVERGENLIAIGLPGRGKTHFLAAIAHELILRKQYSVLFTPTFQLIQRLLQAKTQFKLECELKKLNNYDIIIIDDLGYVEYSRQEMEVFFTFLAERYERKSLMISTNKKFSEWDKIFQDPMTAMAAVDRLVHHATILEFDGVSIRQQVAEKRQKLAQETTMK